MLKYVDTKVTFSEVPDEITLCINVSGCPCNCKGCHSSYLAEDIGTELTEEELGGLLARNKGISCISFMGGDANPSDVNSLSKFVRANYPELKTAWYSGRQELSGDIKLINFDYIKLGPYTEELGPLNSKTTNQRMYKIVKQTSTCELVDITNKFWKK